jgi:hypothetical protein
MRLCLLLGRHHPPYSKWMGSVFAQLPESASLTPILRVTLAVTDQRQREWHLARNDETVTPGIPNSGSPNLSIRAFAITTRGLSGVTRRSMCQGAAVRSNRPYLSGVPLLGCVDRYADSTGLLTDRDRTRATANVALAAFPD